MGPPYLKCVGCKYVEVRTTVCLQDNQTATYNNPPQNFVVLDYAFILSLWTEM